MKACIARVDTDSNAPRREFPAGGPVCGDVPAHIRGVLASTGTASGFTWVGTLGYVASAGMPHAEYYNLARILSSMDGRWTSVDPVWPRRQAYVYGASDPLNLVDPTGLGPCSDFSSPVGTVIEIVKNTCASASPSPYPNCVCNTSKVLYRPLAGR